MEPINDPPLGRLQSVREALLPGRSKKSKTTVQNSPSIAPLVVLADAPIQVSEDLEAAKRFAEAARSPSTQTAYQGEWRRFDAYCRSRGIEALPADPAIVAAYVGHLGSKYSVSTTTKALAAIALAHRTAGFDSPTDNAVVRQVTKGVRRVRGVAPEEQKEPLLLEHLAPIIAAFGGESVRDIRDRALITFGWASAMRRSELSALQVRDLAFDDRGVRVTIRASKTDQEGRGAVIGVPRFHHVAICPVRRMQNWLNVLGDVPDDSPVFRGILGDAVVQEGTLSGRGFNRAVKRAVEKIGLQPEQFGAHSLRAGFVTSCAARGVSEVAIARVSRHRSLEVLSSYVRLASIFDSHPVAAMGL